MVLVELLVDATDEITLAFTETGGGLSWLLSIASTLPMSFMTLALDPFMKAIIPRAVDV